jgi:hypothetical protein
MSDVTNLRKQLDAELAGAKDRAQQIRREWERFGQELEERQEQFDALLERLRPIWVPRLELLRDRFAKVAKAEQPEVKPYARSITFTFTSKYRVELKFSATPDKDVRNLVLECDLLIIPILFKYDRHARLEVPIDRVDEEAVARWLDDRIVSFVKTYVALEGDEFFEQNVAPV